MLLYFHQLVAELRKEFSVSSYNIPQRLAVTDFRAFPADFDYSTQLDPEMVYICTYYQLRKYDPNISLAPLICVIPGNLTPNEAFFRNRPIALVVCSRVETVLLALPRILYRHGCYSSPLADLTGELLKCGTLEELIATGHRLLDNPVIVTDASQRIIAFTDPNLIEAPGYRDVIDQRILPIGHLDDSGPLSGPAAPGSRDVLAAAPVPLLDPGAGELPSVIFRPLTVGRTLLGHIQVLQFSREFTDADYDTVELLGNLCAMELFRHPEKRLLDNDRQLDRFLRSVLDDAMLSPGHIQRQQVALGLKLKPYLNVVIVLLKRRELIPRISFSDMAKSLAQELGNTIGILYRNSFLFLMDSDEPITDFGKRLAPILPTLEKYDLIAGISSDFSDLSDIRKHAFLARKALYFGSKLRPEERLHRFRDYALYYLIEFGLRSEDMDTFCTPEFLRLLDHCRINGPDLLHTLRAYLDCGRSKILAANRLFLHKNTVKYRMTQIENIMGVNLDDDVNALKTLLSLMIADYSEHFHGYTPFSDYMQNH